MNKHFIFRFFCVFLALTYILVTPSLASEIQDIPLYVNERQASENAKIIDNKIYIPFESLPQDSGISFEWNETNRYLSIKSEESTIASVVNKISPSVVGIIGNLKQSAVFNQYGDDYALGPPVASGTGVIYKSNGYIVTNAHVVKDMENIVVLLVNGNAYKAKLKAIDEESDIALIKIDKGGLTPVTFGDSSNIFVGEQVIAIGTPLSFSLQNSATRGIISGVNRAIYGSYRFIQSDAAINSGNSGGPLVNMKGEVIGINSGKYQGFGVEGLSFSIPSNTVKYVLEHFELYGKVKRPYFGFELSEGIAAKYGLPSEETLPIIKIEENSAAQAAGLQIDDEIVAVNGVKIHTLPDFSEEMKKYLPGDAIEFTILRNGQELKVNITSSEKSDI